MQMGPKSDIYGKSCGYTTRVRDGNTHLGYKTVQNNSLLEPKCYRFLTFLQRLMKIAKCCTLLSVNPIELQWSSGTYIS